MVVQWRKCAVLQQHSFHLLAPVCWRFLTRPFPPPLSAAADESVVRAYALMPLANERRGVQAGDVGVTALDTLPKQCAVPFAGNELRFEVGATGGFSH